MNFDKSYLISRFMVILAILLAPTAGNAAARLAIKHGLGDEGRSFAVMVEYSGLRPYDSLNLRRFKETSEFKGIYWTNAKEGAHSSFAWMFNPSKPGQIDIVQVYSFTVNGVTTIAGLYYSLGAYKENTNVGNIAPPVPEPEEYAMFLIGFGMIGYQVRRKRACQQS